MALTLNPILKEAQDGISHKPIVEIISSKLSTEMPFDGQFLTSDPTPETKPNTITHSSGRLCLIYTDGISPGFTYVYTDIERTIFNFVHLSLPSDHTPIEATLCELTDGNIGIVYVATYGTYRKLYYLILSITGEIIPIDDPLIAEYVIATYVIDNPFISRLQNGTYLLVYYHKTVSELTYKIQKRTSGDFITWSEESECEIDGLVSSKPRYNPSLLQISNGNIFLWFDYRDTLTGGVEITNIYYSISTDNGASWGPAVKITDYSTVATVGKHPTSVRKVTDEMHMAFSEVKNALFKQAPYVYPPVCITFDPGRRRLYVVFGDNIGSSGLHGVMEIDVDSWTQTNWWDGTTQPAFNANFFVHGQFNIGTNHRHHGEYPYIPVGIVKSISLSTAAILDVSTNTIIHYHFRTSATYGVTQNISGITLNFNEELAFTWVDVNNNRIYFLFYGYDTLRMGYLEIGHYEWYEKFYNTGIYAANHFYCDSSAWIIEPSVDRIFISMALGMWAFGPGWLRVYSLSSGEFIKEYKKATHPDFPYYGLKRIAYLNGSIYGNIWESVDYAHRGMTVIDLGIDWIRTYLPSWGNYSNFHFDALMAISDHELAMLSNLYGITIFNVEDPSDWGLINNTNTPGLTPSGYNTFYYTIAYDPQQEIIFASNVDDPQGVVAVSRYGPFKSTYFKIGVYSAEWIFGASNKMTLKWLDYDLVMTLNPEPADLSIYAFWVKAKKANFSIKWAKEQSTLDVTPYVVNEAIEISRKIDGTPARLSFTVSHGHLFDPYNLSSLLSIYLPKFRKLNIRFGEIVNEINYWQQQGVFIIKETKIQYKKGEYPTLNVVAEDKMSIWESHQLTATDYYEEEPKGILEDVMTQIGGLTLEECNFPNFDGSAVLYYQWLDVALKDILDQVCQRFSYFPMIDIDGKITARKISDTNSMNHEYDSLISLIDFTPDDSFADFVNRVIITCDGRDLVEAIYPEERVAELHKTVGWWGHKEHHDVWYSVDGSRRCRYPRLEVIESVKNFNFKLGGGSERITGEDSGERFCVVRIESPNLVGWLLIAIVLYIVLRILENLWPQVLGLNVFGILAAILLSLIITTLASVANCSYIVWACPIGYVRQTFQASADNTELQGTLGFSVEKKYHDPLCYTSYQCNVVANQELLVADLQRNRVKLTKIAHLQDEPGDTIIIKHPYSQNNLRLFITDIKRNFKKPSNPNTTDGYFLDHIEAWAIQ